MFCNFHPFIVFNPGPKIRGSRYISEILPILRETNVNISTNQNACYYIHVIPLFECFRTSARRKRNVNSPGKQLVIDHTILLEGTDRSAGTASLSKSLSSLSKGESSIALRGTPATFSEVTLIVNRALNGKCSNICCFQTANKEWMI